MSNEVMFEQIDHIKTVLYDAYSSSKQANEILFKNPNDKTNELIAATYINKAGSLMASLQSLYYSNLEELERQELEDIFLRFDTYRDEFLSNLSSDHSHQWTDIEFNRFEEAIKPMLNLP